MHRRSLRLRVAFAFAGFGALLGLLLCAGLWFAAHDAAQRLMDQTLKAELEDYMARRARNPQSLPPAATHLRGYVAEDMSPNGSVPPAVRGLPPGQHEVRLDGAPYRVAVADRDGDRYYILFNEERQRLREQRFLGYLAGGALAMTLLAAIGGLWLAGRVIAPVTDLAHRVGHAAPDDPPRLSVEEARGDEIGELARAFDRYLDRISAFLDRERAFAADASHELRTPLAVIRGAAEVLAEDPKLSPAQAGRIARIERAAREMSELIDALLLLAREEEAPVDDLCDGRAIVQACAERYRLLAGPRGTEIAVAAPEVVPLPVQPALFAIVVANLIRNAVAHTEGGRVAVTLAGDKLTVEDTGIGIRDEDIGKVFDRYYRGAASRGAGIGLSLVKRICDRCGWRIELANRDGGGTVAMLRFDSR